MEALILDRQYETLDVLDTFESFIWTDRYRGYGDFEIYMPIHMLALSTLKQDCYLMIPSSDSRMIIEDIQTDTDAENGNHLTVTGRSLESLLHRRIIWGHTVLTGNFQDGIQRLLNENIISPSNTNRKIPGFTFKASTDTAITSLTIDTQFLGDDLYEAIFALCEEKDIGFRVLPIDGGGFLFELYVGKDRSYRQEALPYVVFSPSYENMLSSNYLESKKGLKTVALAAGEGEGADRKLIEAADDSGGGSGLDRRELFVDVSGVSSSTSDGALPEEEYIRQLKEKGREGLAETKITKSFEGEIEASHQFIYGRDFFIGDIVQVVNEYGMEARSRVSELVLSQSAEGESINPTFTAIEDDQ